MSVQDGVLAGNDPQQIGDWTILARLGAGGMGVVYLGERNGERAAIKTIHNDLALDESFKKRFAREANAMSTADSPRVAKVLEADIESSPPYIAFKFYDGPNLREVVKDGGPLDAAGLRALATGLAEGLSAIHAQDVVHRDIKPSNIIMTVRGPVIIDFGIAAYHSSEMTQLTVTGEPLGSPTWMSPEYITTGYASEPGDVFGWASTLQFAATGMPPFGIGAPQPLLYRITNVEPTPHRIPGPLGMLMSQSLAKNPANRPTVAEILHTLEVTDGKPFAAAAAGAPPPITPRPPIGAPPPASRTPPPPQYPPHQYQPLQYQPVHAARHRPTLARQLGRSVGRNPAIWAVSLLGLIGLLTVLFAAAGSPSAPTSAYSYGPTIVPVRPYQISTAPIGPDEPVRLPTPDTGWAVGFEPVAQAPPGLELLTDAPSGPARVISRTGLVLYRDPVPESPVLGELLPGQLVIVHPVGMLVDGVAYVHVTSDDYPDLKGFVDLSGLAMDES